MSNLKEGRGKTMIKNEGCDISKPEIEAKTRIAHGGRRI